ncbi:hypothetical protein DEU56DRAFT_61160 [Suillus clintonianus]|uniref:uncharacterized protein n=1 Tax=Suillus clintonianus TaxID=1904413 RepID=UPI001B861905|nr:uncharacterized protein DEU56DRAFT_61160 [Suillus clintonianus]KAG2149350.1 hypothetical protein DEU56DRAFT_61160 [Suillus clintonianus]
MTVSSKPTEQDWHTSSLPSLAYNALPNHQDDCDSIISYSKITLESGNDFYDRSLTSRRYALVGVACSCIVSCCCIVAGTIIVAFLRGNGAIPTKLNTNLQKEMLVLVLNLIVTLCTESTGFVHNIALRSALASERRLRFNTNLRLLTAAHGWRNPNGALLNVITAILLIISYNSASLVILFLDNSGDTTGKAFYVYIAGLPLLLLGVALLLQVMIALSGLRSVKILTWSSSSFDLTAAMVHHTQLTPAPFRCMRGVSDMDVDEGPAKPSETQPSAWHAHPSVRKVIISLWALVVACAGWATLVMVISNKFDGGLLPSPALSSESWSFFPSEQYSNALVYGIPLSGGVSVQWWILSFVNLAVVQGPLTIGLHCSELIANVIRDERHWKSATGRKGLRMATNPLASLFSNPLSLVLLVAKPALHWMFGLSFTLLASGGNQTLEMVAIYMFTAQIWNLCLALFIFACFFTLIALLRPHSPQPAAYGHLQTLANLVDEWSPVMWWGHKEDRASYCHAGTSDHSLPPVKMDCVYAARLGSIHLEPSQ